MGSASDPEVVIVGSVQHVSFPGIGEPASLLPERPDTAAVAVHVRGEGASASREVVRVELDGDPDHPETMPAFDAEPVWVTAGGLGTTRRWFHAVASSAVADERVVELGEVVLAAVETRRTSVRAPLPGEATIEAVGGHGQIRGTLVDISPGGCRMQVPAYFLPQLGQVVDLVATLEAGLLLHTGCTVVRVDDRSPTELGLRFEDLPQDQALRLHREVLRVAVPGLGG